MSVGDASRRCGQNCTTARRTCSGMCAVMSVSTKPVTTWLARMPSGANSCAIACVSPATPALLAP